MILEKEREEGFLIDWDMYVNIGPGAKLSRRIERTVDIFLWS